MAVPPATNKSKNGSGQNAFLIYRWSASLLQISWPLAPIEQQHADDVERSAMKISRSVPKRFQDLAPGDVFRDRDGVRYIKLKSSDGKEGSAAVSIGPHPKGIPTLCDHARFDNGSGSPLPIFLDETQVTEFRVPTEISEEERQGPHQIGDVLLVSSGIYLAACDRGEISLVELQSGEVYRPDDLPGKPVMTIARYELWDVSLPVSQRLWP